MVITLAASALLAMVATCVQRDGTPPRPQVPTSATKLHNHGFTLIEMSIVLVLIGLIVGGVLVGQDLIRASQIRAQITEFEKYNHAVNTF